MRGGRKAMTGPMGKPVLPRSRVITEEEFKLEMIGEVEKGTTAKTSMTEAGEAGVMTETEGDLAKLVWKGGADMMKTTETVTDKMDLEKD